MVLCANCGTQLLRAMGEETITTLEGAEMVFRRTTDYLVCSSPECLRLYSVVRIRESEMVGGPGDLELTAELAQIAKGPEAGEALGLADPDPLPLEEHFEQ